MLLTYNLPEITDNEFLKFQKLIYQLAGIFLPPTKKMLVAGRLGKRLRYYQLDSYLAYYQLVTTPGQEIEQQVMIDLLTTNETYFFREPGHFDFLRQHILNQPAPHSSSQPFRVWSAACSSGEEAYTLAMLMMDYWGDHAAWEIVGSDISQRMLDTARNAHYPIASSAPVPPEYLKNYCLKGVRSQAGTFLIDKKLRRRIHFQQINLNEELPSLGGLFDLILLRNVLIYFNLETKQNILLRVLRQLKPQGYFFIGHAESLLGINSAEIHNQLKLIAPTIYQKQ